MGGDPMTACARCGHGEGRHRRGGCGGPEDECICLDYLRPVEPNVPMGLDNQPAPTPTADQRIAALALAIWPWYAPGYVYDPDAEVSTWYYLDRAAAGVAAIDALAAPSLGERIALAIEAVEPSGLMSASHETAYLAGLIAAARIARETT